MDSDAIRVTEVNKGALYGVHVQQFDPSCGLREIIQSMRPRSLLCLVACRWRWTLKQTYSDDHYIHRSDRKFTCIITSTWSRPAEHAFGFELILVRVDGILLVPYRIEV